MAGGRVAGETTQQGNDTRCPPPPRCKSLDAAAFAGFNCVCVDLATSEMAYGHNEATLPGPVLGGGGPDAGAGAGGGQAQQAQGPVRATVVRLEPGKLYGECREGPPRAAARRT